jgi:hypothetical protein
LIVILGFIISSCDKIDEPYIEPGDPVQTNRKVLLEDFTGHKCPNCPTAGEIALSLKNLYGDRLVLIRIHAGFFALPDQMGLYTADLRSETGNELNEAFEIQSNPNGLINRTPYNDHLVISAQNWAAAVNSIIAFVEDANLNIQHSYNAADKSLNINVMTEFLTEPQGNYNVCLYIVGDTVAPQVNNNANIGPEPDWEDFHHHNVLIQSLNGGTWGIPVNNGEQIIINETYTNNFTGTLKEGWPAERCKLIAFVYKADTREVIQAEEICIVK